LSRTHAARWVAALRRRPGQRHQESWQDGRTQLDSLTGLRIVAAIWVVLHHFRDVTPTETWHFPLIDGLVLHGGMYGVDLFFVLSGFILSHVYFHQFEGRINAADARSFISYRFARLYPVHIVTFAMMVVLFVGEIAVTGRSTAESGRYSVSVFLSSLTLTHTWWGVTTTPNIPAWSISAEWFAYLLFPMLCVAIARIRGGALIFALVGCGLATVWQEVTGHLLIRVMAGFLVGMATYQLARRIPKLTRVPALGTVMVAVIVLWATLGRPPRIEIGILLFAVLILALTSERDWFGRVLSRRTMVYLGEVSYAVYMVHWVVRVAVRSGAEKAGILDSVPPGLVVAVYLAVTMVAAILLYHLVERPWRRRLRRWLAPRPRSRHAAVRADRLPRRQRSTGDASSEPAFAGAVQPTVAAVPAIETRPAGS
jgi:peptidoglycan/LPS O-acetylase OafA/YrhL